jgi:acetolactate synthase-1/3 small subunit
MIEERKHIIAVIVENKPGVLYSVSNMFRRRGFNIDSISVGPIDGRDLARMTIAIKGDEKRVEQIIKQLNKLIDVIKVSKLNPINIIEREMALVKIHASDTRSRSDILNYANIFRAGIVDVSPDTLTVEITGDSVKLDAFMNLMRSFGIREIARTGITALSRGGKSVKIDE